MELTNEGFGGGMCYVITTARSHLSRGVSHPGETRAICGNLVPWTVELRRDVTGGFGAGSLLTEPRGRW